MQQLEDEKKAKLLTDDTCHGLLERAERRVTEVIERGRVYDLNKEASIVKFDLKGEYSMSYLAWISGLKNTYIIICCMFLL